jgi:hypothetical protein
MRPATVAALGFLLLIIFAAAGIQLVILATK